MRTIVSVYCTIVFTVFVFLTLIVVSIIKVQKNRALNELNKAMNATLQVLPLPNLPMEGDAELITEFKKFFRPEELYQDFMKDELFLMAWIRGSDFDLQKAVIKLREHLKWRIENGIDKIVEENFSDFRKVFPYSSTGRDKDGNIDYIILYVNFSPKVVFVPFGKWKLRKSMINLNMTRLNRYIFYVLETTTITLRDLQHSGKSARVVGIVDFTGFNLIDHGCFKCMPLISKVINTYEDNYPESIKTWSLINVSRMGQALIEKFLPLLSPKSNEIFKIYGYKQETWDSDLKEILDNNKDEIAFQIRNSAQQ